MEKKVNVHAITHRSIFIEDSIITPMSITNLHTQTTIQTNGIWDTGATNSVITKSMATKLGLISVNKAMVLGIHGTKEADVYFVNIKLNNENITVNAQVTECEELSADNSVGFLIGMNIITMGDFAITNYQGQTVMSFRVPSIQRIDFVEGIKTGKQIIKDKLPNRNDICFCGSGKKYKYCCGRKNNS